MEIYAVYDTNEDGWSEWIDSYWQNYENALKRAKEISHFSNPSQTQLDRYIKRIKTRD